MAGQSRTGLEAHRMLSLISFTSTLSRNSHANKLSAAAAKQRDWQSARIVAYLRQPFSPPLRQS
jgi:hypothetical protein